MSLDTTDLPVGAFTVWWVIFNNPSACTNNDCGASDLYPDGEVWQFDSSGEPFPRRITQFDFAMDITFLVPEPTTALLLASGLVAMAVGQTARKRTP